jgi:glutathione S-transferase
MKLHYNPASPFVRMVTVTAHELGIAGQINTVPTGEFLPDRINKQVEADNPLGRIPALVSDHGSSLYDSRVICEYLCHHAGDKQLLPDEPVRRFRLLTLQSLAIGLMDSAVNLRYETGLRPEPKRWPEWINRQKVRIEHGLDDMERNWATELSSVNCGSIATACLLGYLDFRYADMGWRNGRDKLAMFYETFARRDSMQATTPPA